MLHIVAIGWLWVAFMMAITERSIVAGAMTFVFYGLVPCAILIYLLATPARRRRASESAERATATKDESRPTDPCAKPPVNR